MQTFGDKPRIDFLFLFSIAYFLTPFVVFMCNQTPKLFLTISYFMFCLLLNLFGLRFLLLLLFVFQETYSIRYTLNESIRFLYFVFFTTYEQE